MSMGKCPRCGAPTKRLTLLGLELTSRLGFSVSWAVALGVIEFTRAVYRLQHVMASPHGEYYVQHTWERLWRVPLSAASRLLVVYALMWPVWQHFRHQESQEHAFWEGIWLSILIATVCFMNSLILPSIFDLFHCFER